MKKTVFVSSLQIFPAMSGGQLRSANLCRALVKLGFAVDAYSLTGRKEDYLQKKSSFVTDVEPHLRETVNMNPFWGLVQFAFYRFNLPPLWVTWLLKLFVPQDLKTLLREADLVILDFPFLYPLFDLAAGAKWLNTHNAEFDLWADRPALSGYVRKLEIQAMNQAQHVVFCAEGDREKFLNAVPGLLQKSSIVSNGVDLQQFQFTGSMRAQVRESLQLTSQHKVFLFTGSSYHPNQEAFAYLKDFCAQHRQQLIDNHIVILVVGTVSQDLVGEPHFKVLGKVPEIQPFFAASDFGLNPVMKGSGVNVKMVEFIAARLPILSTAFGCRGLDLKDRLSCYIFERENLLNILLAVVPESPEVIEKISDRAFQDNENRVDMNQALKQTLKLQSTMC